MDRTSDHPGPLANQATGMPSAMDAPDANRCPKCGRARSGPLRNNCPACLVRLCVLDGDGDSGEPGGGVGSEARRLGDYELLGEIARGGMGVVHRARQAGLNRMVAVKVLLAGHFASPAFRDRFRREAEAAASLHHPNIVAVYEVAEHLGQPYFSMELIEGRSLAEVVRDQPMPAREAAQLLKTLAEAVHYAHERGVLHRDLKPSNVIIDARGIPHITDFGLAKRLDDSGTAPRPSELTLTGQVLGSPNFMPPEQADPRRGPTTAASDVYSLGAILYQLLSGRPPFLAETLAQTLRLVVESEAVSVRLLNPALSRDLETLCQKCLEKDPSRRYRTAQELAEELGRFLRGEPIRARPLAAPARLVRWCRRSPALAFSLLTGAASLLVASIGLLIALIWVDGARKQAEMARAATEDARRLEAQHRARAESAERGTELQLYAALLEQARATTLSGEMGHRVRALEAIRRAASLSNSAALRREVFAALALPDFRLLRELPYGEEFTLRLPDPGFRRIAVARGRGPVEIRSLDDDRLLASLPASTNLPAYVGEWSADGRWLAIKRDYPGGGLRSDREIWELPEGTGPETLARMRQVLRDIPRDTVAFHPRSGRILAGRKSEVVLVDLNTGEEMASLRLPGAPSRVRFSPDGERFAALCAVAGTWQLSVHDAKDGTLRCSQGFGVNHANFAWHPGGLWLAVCDYSGQVQSMDVETGTLRVLGRHRSEATDVDFTADGNYLTTGGWGGELFCWDARTRQRSFVVRLDGFDGQFREDGRRYALRCRLGMKLLAFESPAGCRDFPEDLGARLQQAAFSGDGRWLTASGERQLGVWDLVTGGPAALRREAHDAHGFFTADGSELVASRSRGDGDPAGFRWRVTAATRGGSPPELERLELPRSAGFRFLSVHSNSMVLTTTNGTRLLPAGQVETGPGGWQPTMAGMNRASPDGRWLGVLPHYSRELEVYRLPGLEAVARLTALPALGGIYSFEFSPAGDELALFSDRSVELWSPVNWERRRVLANFGRPFLYAPDGRSFWLTQGMREAGLYDAATLAPRLLLPGGTLPLAITRDGRHLAVSIDFQRLRIWDLAAVYGVFHELGLGQGFE